MEVSGTPPELTHWTRTLKGRVMYPPGLDVFQFLTAEDMTSSPGYLISHCSQQPKQRLRGPGMSSTGDIGSKILESLRSLRGKFQLELRPRNQRHTHSTHQQPRPDIENFNQQLWKQYTQTLNIVILHHHHHHQSRNKMIH